LHGGGGVLLAGIKSRKSKKKKKRKSALSLPLDMHIL
jgi:hypothetical protein